MAKIGKDSFVIDTLRAKILLVLCCILCYALTVKNGYCLDDDFAFYQNRYVQEGVKGIPDILTHPYFNDGNLSFDYRPVTGITFAIEKDLFGNNAHEAHLVNLALYILCVLLVFSISMEVFGLDATIAFVIALFFAIHPAHIEVVASIKNREELFSCLFALLSFQYLYRLFLQKDFRSRIIHVVLVIVFLLLSYASKLTSLPMIVIMAVYLYYKGMHRQRALFFSTYGLLVVITTIYFFIILGMQNRPVFDLENPLVTFPHDLSMKIGTAGSSLLFYLRFLCVPYPFSFYYGYNTIPVIPMDNPIAVLSIFLHLIAFVYGVIRFFKKDIVGFFIIAYFISMSIYSNMLMIYTGIVSERALFFPSLWFIAAVSVFIYKKVFATQADSIFKPVVIGFASLLLTVYGVLDINRVSQWHDTIKLMSADVKHLENSTLANYFYACILKNNAEATSDTALRSRYLAESKRLFYHVCAISSTYPYGYFRLGLIDRYDSYVPDSAFYYFKRAYTLNPNLTDVAFQYGRAEYEYGDQKLACDVFNKLYQRIPGDTFTVFYHALLLMKTGQLAEGHQVNNIFMNMGPNYYQSYFNEGFYYQMTGDPDNAARNYERSIQLGCVDPTVYRFLADYYQRQGRTADANKYIRLLQ